MERIPAEVFPPGVYIKDEMKARGWTEDDLLARIPGMLDRLAVQLITNVENKNLIMDPATATALGKAFDVSPQFFLNLDAAWRGVDPLPAISTTPHNGKTG